MDKLKPVNIYQYLACSLGIFFIGFSIAYIGLLGLDKGSPFLIIGIILSLPGFYLLYKHK